jgi:hypothetical protein
MCWRRVDIALGSQKWTEDVLHHPIVALPQDFDLEVGRNDEIPRPLERSKMEILE